jgi:hypothetical protein
VHDVELRGGHGVEVLEDGCYRVEVAARVDHGGTERKSWAISELSGKYGPIRRTDELSERFKGVDGSIDCWRLDLAH